LPWAGIARPPNKGMRQQKSPLETCTHRGRGVAQDKKQANAWFKRAADQGNASAQQNLANALYFGDGAEINYAEAFKLYQQAAAQGYGDSQYNLGVMYEKGQGVSKDAAQAYFWWLLASAREVPDAARNRDRIEKSLTPAQRTEAQTAARQWKPALAQANRSNLETRPGGAVSRGQKNEPDVTGTAFRISPTHYVTNFHVVHGCQRLRVSGTQSAERQASDERNDLALLSVPASSGATAIIRIGRIHLGEQVTAVGFPLLGIPSSTLSVTSGEVGSLSDVQGIRVSYKSRLLFSWQAAAPYSTQAETSWGSSKISPMQPVCRKRRATSRKMRTSPSLRTRCRAFWTQMASTSTPRGWALPRLLRRLPRAPRM